MIKQAYLNGFMKRCAQRGVDGRALIKRAFPIPVSLERVDPEELYPEEDLVQAKIRRNREKFKKRLHMILGASMLGGLGAVGTAMYRGNKRGKEIFDAHSESLEKKIESLEKELVGAHDNASATWDAVTKEHDHGARDRAWKEHVSASDKEFAIRSALLEARNNKKNLSPELVFAKNDILPSVGGGALGAILGGLLGNYTGELSNRADRDLGIDPFTFNVRRDPHSDKRNSKKKRNNGYYYEEEDD